VTAFTDEQITSDPNLVVHTVLHAALGRWPSPVHTPFTIGQRLRNQTLRRFRLLSGDATRIIEAGSPAPRTLGRN